MSSFRFTTPQEAEDAFYRAFAAADVEAMMAVWADDDAVTCVHPAGPRLDGLPAIRRSWQVIFSNTLGIEFLLTDARRVHDAQLAVHLVLERIRAGRGGELNPPVIATNVYRLTQHGWRMILHHASSGPAPQHPAQGPLH